MRRKYGVIGGLLVSAVLALTTASATSAQTQPTPVPDGVMGGPVGTSGAGAMAPDGMMGGTGTSSGTTAPGGMLGGQGMMGGSGAGAQQATPLDSLDSAKQSFQG